MLDAIFLQTGCIKAWHFSSHSNSSILSLTLTTMKLSLVFIFVLVTCVSLPCVIGNAGTRNDYVWGAKTSTSTLIAKEIITKRKALLSTVTKTYTLTQSGTAKTINYIKITDLKLMRGATAEITSGGVSSTTLTVDFTSAPGSSIKSQIEIWGAAS